MSISSSETFWNQLHLAAPEIVSCEIKGEKQGIICSGLVLCFDKISTDLKSLNQMNIECAMISRIVYKYKRKMRLDKGFKCLQKLNHLLHNYLTIKMKSVAEDVKCCVYERNGPSKQTLQWCLVSILRLSALFHKIYIACMEGAWYFKERLTSGDYWKFASMCFASISRIWIYAQYIVKCSSSWYKELKAFLPYMNSFGDAWLPETFKLPASVSKWLDNPSYLTTKSIEGSRENMEAESSSGETLPSCKSYIVAEDLGETICRETGDVVMEDADPDLNKTSSELSRKLSLNKRNIKSEKSNINKCLKQLTSKEALIKFMCNEGVMRQTGSNCVTKRLSDQNWTELKSQLSKQLSRMVKFHNKREEENKMERAIKCIKYYLFHSCPDLTMKN